jgi:hypothetical protein
MKTLIFFPVFAVLGTKSSVSLILALSYMFSPFSFYFETESQ